MNTEQVQFEIETLFHSSNGYREQNLAYSVTAQLPSVEHQDEENHVWSDQQALKGIDEAFPSSSKQHHLEATVWRAFPTPLPINKGRFGKSFGEEEDETTCLKVKGPIIPIEYEVKGVKSWEMPVIGTYIDERITPGFRYYVRPLDGSAKLFSGDALALQSIGLGYGRRITFESKDIMCNDNFFWSDSCPEGYAFSVDAVQIGQKFRVYSIETDKEIGSSVVDDVIMQKEISSSSVNRSTKKKIAVVMCITVHYDADSHGLLPLHQEERHEFLGKAIVVKDRGARFASLRCIEITELPSVGAVNLYPPRL